MRWLMALKTQVKAALRVFYIVPYRPSRVGLLNTGELVLVDGLGHSTIFSTETTGLMRNALIDTEPDTSELLVGVPGFATPQPCRGVCGGVQPCSTDCTD
jgi:hypothetical protein